MTTRRFKLAAVPAIVVFAAAFADNPASLTDSTAADRTSVAVTVYNQNLALVRETRTLDLDKTGVGTLRFMDVPSKINPRTVHVQPLSAGGPAVIEQNYEYDLISPEKLMEKYVGREVELVEQAEDLTNRTVKATLLSTNGGPVYRIGDRIVIGQGGKVTLPDLPADLVARPTLVWTLDVPKAGPAPAEVSYLTDGMNWSADYVAVVDAEDKKAGLSGWVTIDNHSGATFSDATLKLVAGDVRRVAPQQLMDYEAQGKMMRMASAAPQFQEESFFEYHLYTLDRKTTVKDNQTKQLSLFTAPSVPVTKMSRWSVRRETAVTGAPGAARPSRMGHQPCQPSVWSGAQAAVCTRPSVSERNTSRRLALRDTATGAPGPRMLEPGAVPSQWPTIVSLIV